MYQKKSFPIKQIAKKQRINRKDTPISLPNKNNELHDVKNLPSEESSPSSKEIREIKAPSSEDDEYSSTSIILAPAKPVIDPNDSVEYESELKMLEEFYQAKSFGLTSLSAYYSVHGQPFTEEDGEEELYEDKNHEISELGRDENEINNNSQLLYRPERASDEATSRSGDQSQKDVE